MNSLDEFVSYLVTLIYSITGIKTVRDDQNHGKYDERFFTVKLADISTRNIVEILDEEGQLVNNVMRYRADVSINSYGDDAMGMVERLLAKLNRTESTQRMCEFGFSKATASVVRNLSGISQDTHIEERANVNIGFHILINDIHEINTIETVKIEKEL